MNSSVLMIDVPEFYDGLNRFELVQMFRDACWIEAAHMQDLEQTDTEEKEKIANIVQCLEDVIRQKHILIHLIHTRGTDEE